jgi:hypothetical protein
MSSAAAEKLLANEEVVTVLDEFDTRFRVTSPKNMKMERVALMDEIWEKLVAIYGDSRVPVTQEIAFKVHTALQPLL